MQILEVFRTNLHKIEEKIGYKFKDSSLLEQAFVHKSFINEQVDLVKGNNERLEFLGDAVLGFIMSEFLYAKFPNLAEGALSELRARLVESKALQKYIEQINIAEFLIVGKGEAKEDRKGSLNANLFEAILGAIYIDGGVSAAKDFLFTLFQENIDATCGSPPRNWKAEFQDFAQKEHLTKPVYEVIHEEGPDHAKVFHVIVKINENLQGFGVGTSKKQAETNAAKEAITKVNKDE